MIADHPVENVEALTTKLREVDWKVQDVVVAVVRELENAPDDVIVRPDDRNGVPSRERPAAADGS